VNFQRVPTLGRMASQHRMRSAVGNGAQGTAPQAQGYASTRSPQDRHFSSRHSPDGFVSPCERLLEPERAGRHARTPRVDAAAGDKRRDKRDCSRSLSSHWRFHVNPARLFETLLGGRRGAVSPVRPTPTPRGGRSAAADGPVHGLREGWPFWRSIVNSPGTRGLAVSRDGTDPRAAGRARAARGPGRRGRRSRAPDRLRGRARAT